MRRIDALAAVAAAAVLTLPTMTAAVPSRPATKFNWDKTQSVLAFGDSYSYVQGTHGLQNYSFIGDLQHFAFTPQDLLSDRIVQNQTATAEGGPNWLEYLTGCGLPQGLTDPQSCNDSFGGKALWDFAFAGSDISVQYTPLHHNFTVSLVNQIQQFATYAQPVLAPAIISPHHTLVSVWIGINDVSDSAAYNVTSFPAFYAELATTLFASLQTVYDLGYRDFLVMQLPPLDRTPPNLVRKGGPLPNATMVQWYDDALGTQAGAFGRKNRGANVMVFPTTAFLNGVLDHPLEYGVVNTTAYCPGYDQPYINTDPAMYGCLPLDEYFWFNTGHMTSHTHKILADAVLGFLDEQR